MKGKLTILLIVVLLSSCGFGELDKKPHTKYYYSNGTIIRDSSLIELLNKELVSLNIGNSGSKIFCTLNPSESLEFFTDSLRNLYVQSIRENNPDKLSFLDTMNQFLLYDVGVVVYDNSTGNTIYRQEPKTRLKNLESMMGYGKSSRFLGMFLTMDKGFNIEDKYQAFQNWDDSVKIYNEKNEVVDYWYNDGKRTMKRLFYLESGGEIPKFPYQEFVRNDWSEFASKLKIGIHSECLSSGSFCEIESNFIDLVESFMLVRNLGNKKNTSLVSKIIDSKGKVIYVKKLKSETTVSHNTIDKMTQLLENNLKNGTGQFFKKELNLTDECHIYWGQNQRDIGWVLYSDTNFTVGIILKGMNTLTSGPTRHFLRLKFPQKSPRTLLPLLKTIREDICIEYD